MPKIKILIVEDESLVALNYKLFLEQEGYEVIGIVKSGEEAIQQWKEKQPDIVLMDIMLSGKKNGIEAAAVIKEDNGPALIYITGNDQFFNDTSLRSTRPVAVLSKPVEEKALNRIIRSIG